MLQIFLLGPLQLHLDGASVDHLSTSKVQALLGYLATENEHAHRRETLAGLLWPNYKESSARVNLRQTLKRLHQLVPPETISATRLEIGFNRHANCTRDIDLFTERLTRYRREGNIEVLKEAVPLYRGDFLAQIWLDDCAEFEEWLLLKREWLRREMLDALHQLTAHAINEHQLDDAFYYARQQVELDAYNEAAHHQLIEALAKSGRRAEALQRFTRYCELLEKELSSAPSNATVALIERIRAGDIGQTDDLTQGFVSDASSPITVTNASNLPAPNTPLLGRKREIAELVSLLTSSPLRVITIVGPGGIGKTRLALAVAEEVSDIRFVPLQSVGSTDAIAPAIADAINFRFAGNDSPQEQLCGYLQHKEILLLLDNFEHLLDGVDLLIDLLRVCPKVRFLVTSRERLNMQQEQVFALDGLAYPTTGAVTDGHSYPAVDLFMQIARRARRDFAVDAAGQAQIGALCQHVEGMPLALELAASWVHVLPLAEIAQTVAQSLNALAFNARDLPDRHRNMHAVFDLTWQRMTEAEQQLFARLSIFRGGFTRAAAEEIADASMHQLALLVNKSLVRYNADADRYSLHELLRQYGQEQLEVQVDEPSAVRDRYSAYFCTWLATNTGALRSLDRPIMQTPFAAELDNVTQAWEWAVCHRQVERMQDAIDGFGTLLYRMARYHEGAARFEQALQQMEEMESEGAAVTAQQYIYVHLLCWCGDCLHYLGQNTRANWLLKRAMEILRDADVSELDTRHIRARVLVCLGDTEHGSRAQICYQTARELAQSVGDRRLEAGALQSISEYLLHESSSSLNEAQAVAEESLRIYREIGDFWGISWNLEIISSIALNRGDSAVGRRAIGESLKIRQQLGLKSDIPRCYSHCGHIAMLLGKFDESIEYYRQSLDIWLDLNVPTEIIHGKCDIARGLLFAGNYTDAHAESVNARVLCQGTSDTEYLMAHVNYNFGLLALVEDAYADALQYFQLSIEQSPMPYQRAFARSALVLAARGLGDIKNTRDSLDEALQFPCESHRYFATIHTLNAAVLLLADAGDLDYARKLYTLLEQQPFNANSRWFADAIDSPYLRATQASSAKKKMTAVDEKTRRWIERTKEQCQTLSSLIHNE